MKLALPNKTKTSMVLLFTILIVFIMLLCSCSSQKENNDNFNAEGVGYDLNLSICYCNRMNSSAAPSEDKIGNYIMSYLNGNRADAKSQTSSINVIGTDGKPTVSSINEKGSKKNVDDNRKSDNIETTKKIINQLNEKKAQTEEADIFESIGIANERTDNTNNLVNVLIVCDSGISTKGKLNMLNNNIISANIDDVTSTAKLANLNKIDKVLWVGLNQTCDDQERIPSESLDNIKKLYTEVLKNAGVGKDRDKKKDGDKISDDQVVEFISASDKSSNNSKDLPKVTPVKFNNITQSDYEKFEKGENSTLTFTESQIKFDPDKSTFVDPNTASNILNNVANILKKNQNITVLINGYISSPVPETGTLSQERADKVKEELQNLGVNENQMTAKGCGQGPYPYMKDGIRNADNRFIEIKRK